jgi:hypothetical protein
MYDVKKIIFSQKKKKKKKKNTRATLKIAIISESEVYLNDLWVMDKAIR